MEDKNSHEDVIETAIDINGLSSELKSDISGHTENINRIIVSQYIDDQNVNDDNYAVTYSEEDNSIVGWTVNIEENGQQQPDVYFKFDKEYDIDLFVLCKRTLVFDCYGNDNSK